MTRKILCLVVLLVFLGCLAPLCYGAITFKIGNKDGFGFDPAYLVDKVGTTGLPVDTNGNGKLEPGEFLPDINLNGHYDELPPELGGDGFDNRTDKEKAATNGAQFTDVSYDLSKVPIWFRMYEVEFMFDVSVLAGLPLKGAELQLIYSDFDGDCPDPYCCVCTEVYADDQLIGNAPLTDPEQGGIGEAIFDVPVELLEDGSVTITFESADSIEFDIATLKVKLETENVKPLVRLRKMSGTLDEDPVPGGPAGTYTVKYRLKNKSTIPIWAPFIKFKTDDPGILLLNADGGPKGNGAVFTPDVGEDAQLTPEERVTFYLIIGLTEKEVPDFKTKVRGLKSP